MAIKLLTFDLDNTLWDIDPVMVKVEEQLRLWLATHLPAALAFYQADNLQKIRSQLIKETPEIARLPTRLRKALLRRCFQQAGLGGETLSTQVELAFARVLEVRNQIDFFPETLPLLQELSQSYTLMAISNGNADIHKVGLNPYFSAHFAADACGKPKPDTYMFAAALEKAQVRAQESIHIGDHPQDDIAAAKKLGLHTIWFNQDGRDSSRCQADREIQQLKQLHRAIAEIAAEQLNADPKA